MEVMMTEQEYEAALVRIEYLMDLDDAEGLTDELGDELDRLVDEVITYEDKHYPISS
jgi:antitoxin component HigA of HigAB toxin-antitoxin module